MNMKNTLGLLVIVGSVVGIGYAAYRKYQAEIGPEKEKTKRAEEQAKSDIEAGEASVAQTASETAEAIAELERKAANAQTLHNAQMAEYDRKIAAMNERHGKMMSLLDQLDTVQDEVQRDDIIRQITELAESDV